MTIRWNHNLHHNPLILAAAPAECRRALDIGCGEGVLTRALRSVAQRVVGIDIDPPSIEQARAQAGDGIDYVLGDFLVHRFEPASFDLVVSVAALHHVDAERGLRRMAELVRPGGVLVVIGLARSRALGDWAFDLAGAVATRVHKHVLGKGYWEHSAPQVWPPPLDYSAMRRIAERVLPGVRYQRHVLWRYSLVWTRPLGEAPAPAPARGARRAAPTVTEIREYDPARDAASVRACFVELQEFERGLDPRMPPGEQIADAYLKLLLSRCDEFGGIVLVACAGDLLVGYVAVLTRYRSSEPDDSAEAHGFITDLVVSAPHRGGGVGRALLRAAEARARLAGAGSLRLSVKAGNEPAQALYAAEGFAPSIIELEKRLVEV